MDSIIIYAYNLLLTNILGKLSDSIGKIKIFRIGTFIFIIGSLLCGTSKSIEMLLLSGLYKHWVLV